MERDLLIHIRVNGCKFSLFSIDLSLFPSFSPFLPSSPSLPLTSSLSRLSLFYHTEVPFFLFSICRYSSLSVDELKAIYHDDEANPHSSSSSSSSSSPLSPPSSLPFNVTEAFCGSLDSDECFTHRCNTTGFDVRN